MIAAAVKRELARRKRTSVALSYLARYAGYEELGATLARNANVVAPVVPVFVRVGEHRPRFLMQSCGGRDQIARNVWNFGWTGFEHPLPDLIARLASQLSGSFLDVGANTGFYSLVAARANPGLSVFAFEPFPPVFELLAANIALNAPAPSIRAVPLALGAEDGSAQLYVPLQDHGLVETSCSLNPSFKGAHSAVFTVQTTTVDRFVATNAMATVSLMKIDVEGFEDAVFEGATQTIERSRPLVVYEVLPHARCDRIQRFCADHRYRSYRLRPGGPVPEDAVAFDADAWNHVMVPEERLAFAEAVFARLGGPSPQ